MQDKQPTPPRHFLRNKSHVFSFLFNEIMHDFSPVFYPIYFRFSHRKNDERTRDLLPVPHKKDEKTLFTFGFDTKKKKKMMLSLSPPSVVKKVAALKELTYVFARCTKLRFDSPKVFT